MQKMDPNVGFQENILTIFKENFGMYVFSMYVGTVKVRLASN
jgi:hypothetical protein